ncbi:MAG: hypothetical protein JRH07_18655, partial [Deltaproteobacteria bacterium]|nr:hypothetical protein [Deltaproteobacteria bacterium]
KQEHRIHGQLLPYRVEKGGVFLKDAAVLAGIGIVGRNNLLITPEFGPRVRMRALLVDARIHRLPREDFDPCSGCDMPCRRACPRDAFEPGFYLRVRCQGQMQADIATASGPIRYCRLCELACNMGTERVF